MLLDSQEALKTLLLTFIQSGSWVWQDEDDSPCLCSGDSLGRVVAKLGILPAGADSESVGL
jgi:hypothetical protein